MFKNKSAPAGRRAMLYAVLGSLLSLLASDSAMAQTAKIPSFKAGKALKEQVNAAFFNDRALTPAELKILSTDKDAVFDFFGHRYTYGANPRHFDAFKREFGDSDARDLGISTYITRFKTPNLFFMFSDNLWRDFNVAWKDAGYTWREDVTQAQIDEYLFKYFSTHTVWDLNAAFNEFKKTFGINGIFTLATFRDYFFIRGLLDYAAITATDVTAVDRVDNVDFKAVD